MHMEDWSGGAQDSPGGEEQPGPDGETCMEGGDMTGRLAYGLSQSIMLVYPGELQLRHLVPPNSYLAVLYTASAFFLIIFYSLTLTGLTNKLPLLYSVQEQGEQIWTRTQDTSTIAVLFNSAVLLLMATGQRVHRFSPRFSVMVTFGPCSFPHDQVEISGMSTEPIF